jgi:hypothetical protein
VTEAVYLSSRLYLLGKFMLVLAGNATLQFGSCGGLEGGCRVGSCSHHAFLLAAESGVSTTCSFSEDRFL